MLKFYSKPVSEHPEVPLADDGALEQLLERYDRTSRHGEPESSACYVVSVGPDDDPVSRTAQLSEIVALVEHQGGHVVGKEIVHLRRPHARTLLGPGIAQAIAERAREHGATQLVLDAELTPSQARNLEDTLELPVCDREAVILNVFFCHARTRRAKIQVEIAKLEYLRPRIRGLGLDMDQQMGGSKYARGPGETASELMARQLDSRLKQLKKALAREETSGHVQRQRRSACERVALLGYTNAGKTSLMNALTSAGLSARNMPFETLDTTSRCLTRHGGEIVLSDTVGVIRRLPERLLASFHSTLSEVSDASLLLIVVDISDPERELQLATTHRLIEQVEATEVPRFYVFNKLDRLPEPPDSSKLEALCEGHPWLALSAHDPKGVAELERRIVEQVRRGDETRTLFVPYSDNAKLSLIYAQCRVLSSEAQATGLRLSVSASRAVMARLERQLKEKS